MKNAAIVLARMDSERFPGKPFSLIKGNYLIDWCLEGISQGNNYEVILATSEREVDAPLAEYVKNSNYHVFKGDLGNVAKRIKGCLDYYQIQYFARINGDTPFPDAYLVDIGFDLMEHYQLDLVTNLMKRSFPYGYSLEILNSLTFSKHLSNISDDPVYCEHITKYFYENKGSFKSIELAVNPSYENTRLVVDHPNDIKSLETKLDNDPSFKANLLKLNF